MIMKIKKRKFKILLILLFILFVYHEFYDTNHISGGDLLEESFSPNKQYILKAYRIDGGALSADSVRVELINDGNVKNIYFNYPENNVKITWLNETTVEINGKQLNILKDKYDWRK